MKFAQPFARLHARLAFSTMVVAAFLTALQNTADALQGDAAARAPNALWSAAGDVAGTALVALGIGWVAGALAARPFTQRLARMNEAAQAWAEGELERRINDDAEDEIAALAFRLDTMAAEMKHTFALRQTLAVAEERERLAQELHDGVKQQMFALALHLGAAHAYTRDLAAPNAALSRSLKAAHDLAAQSQRDLLRLVQTWSGLTIPPAAEHDTGRQEEPLLWEAFAADLYNSVRPWERNGPDALRVVVSVSPQEAKRVLPTHAAKEIKAIALEAVANAARHAAAERVDIRLTSSAPSENMFCLCVCDNGRGFDANRKHQGLGLEIMRERAERLAGGALTIKSAPGRGCEVKVTCRLAPASEPAKRCVGIAEGQYSYEPLRNP